jgi:hypothetical protein
MSVVEEICDSKELRYAVTEGTSSLNQGNEVTPCPSRANHRLKKKQAEAWRFSVLVKVQRDAVRPRIICAGKPRVLAMNGMVPRTEGHE